MARFPRKNSGDCRYRSDTLGLPAAQPTTSRRFVHRGRDISTQNNVAMGHNEAGRVERNTVESRPSLNWRDFAFKQLNINWT